MIYIYTYICGAQTLEVVPGTPSQSWSSHACVMPTPWVWKDLCVASNQQNTAIVAGWVWLWSHKILASPSLSSAFVLSLRKQVGVWDNSVWQEPGDACRAEGGASGQQLARVEAFSPTATRNWILPTTQVGLEVILLRSSLGWESINLTTQLQPGKTLNWEFSSAMPGLYLLLKL